MSGSQAAPNAIPQFTLRAMLLGTGGLAAALAIWQAVSPVMGLTLLMLFTMVFLHVAGNALGTRLREQGTRHGGSAGRDDLATEQAPFARARAARVEAHQFAPVTNLGRRAPLGWSPVVVTCCAGLIGAVAGGRALQRLSPESATWSTLIVGGLAAGALAVMFAFWTASWLQVLLGAWWQAHREAKRR